VEERERELLRGKINWEKGRGGRMGGGGGGGFGAPGARAGLGQDGSPTRPLIGIQLRIKIRNEARRTRD
jgi:hypothetical protein